MKIIFALALTLTYVSISNAAFARQTQLTFSTGTPVILKHDPSIMPSMREDEYRKIAEQFSQYSFFVPIRRKPVRLSTQAVYGINFVFRGINRSWILDKVKNRGYILYADLNANGNLRDDPPLKFKSENKHFSLTYKTTITETINGIKESYPLLLRLDLNIETLPGQTIPRLSINNYDKTARTGKLRFLNGQEIIFKVIGAAGQYQHDYHSVFFDTNGDQQFELGNLKSSERYSVSEKFVNLENTSYEFVVDRYGRTLTLKPLSAKLPERASLLIGSSAPEFSFVDINGESHRLSDYRKKIVLLNFWTTHCQFCVAEAPKLTAAYKRLQEKGFEIISINGGNDLNALQTFASTHETKWMQVREEATGALHKMFRVQSTPTYFVINTDGKIVADGHKIEKMVSEIEKHLEQAPNR